MLFLQVAQQPRYGKPAYSLGAATLVLGSKPDVGPLVAGFSASRLLSPFYGKQPEVLCGGQKLAYNAQKCTLWHVGHDPDPDITFGAWVLK